MPDADDVTVATTAQVNPGQLSHELGGAPLKVVGPDADNVTRVRVLDDPDNPTDVDLAALARAVDAHVADDDWQDPNAAPDTAADDIARLAELRAEALERKLSRAELDEAVTLALRLGAL